MKLSGPFKTDDPRYLKQPAEVRRIIESRAEITTEEREEFRRLLKQYPGGAVECFIIEVGMLLPRVLLAFSRDEDPLTYNPPSKTDHRSRSREATSAFKKTKKILRRVAKGQGLPWQATKIRHVMPTRPDQTPDSEAAWMRKANTATVQAARRALADLEAIEAAFIEAAGPARTGHPGTKNAELTKEVLEAYRRHICIEPTGTKEDQFPAVLAFIFKMVGITYKDTGDLARDIIKETATR